MGALCSIMSSSSYYLMYLSSKHQGVRGLFNYGLSCCANALLQSFSATRELVELLDRWQTRAGMVEKYSMPLQMRKALHAMQGDQGQHAPHQDFLDCLHHHAISRHSQQDADEVFLTVLQTIQEQSERELAAQIKSLFRIMLEGVIVCSECTYPHTHHLRDESPCLSEGKTKLTDCIQSFFQPQELSGGNKCYCDRCGEKTASTQRFKLISLPTILCLQLKRFRSTSYGTRKLNCNVNRQYNLYAVIVHSGTASFGHYTAYIKPAEDQNWYYADDSSVKMVSWEEVKSSYGGGSHFWTKNAYMLMYRGAAAKTEQQTTG